MNIHNPEMAGKRAPPPWEQFSEPAIARLLRQRTLEAFHDLVVAWAKQTAIVENEPGISLTEKAQPLDLALTAFVLSAMAGVTPMQKSDTLRTLNTLLGAPRCSTPP